MSKLSGVNKTLLVPLYCRAQMSKRDHTFFSDPLAVKLFTRLKRLISRATLKQLAKTDSRWLPLLAGRAYQFDRVVKRFSKQHPAGTIVNLGAGLETAFARLDNGVMQWVDIDLPAVMKLRNKLLPRHTRVLCISKSILDFTWIAEVKKLPGPYLFMAAGLLMYFSQREVKKILVVLAQTFPRSKLLFDTITTEDLRHFNKMARTSQANVFARWSLDNPLEIEQWHSRLKVVAYRSYYKNIRTKKCYSLIEKTDQQVNAEKYQHRILEVRL